MVGSAPTSSFLQVHLFFPESGSLKAKRAELNRVKAHLRQRHGASVAEVDHQDTWQRSTLAVALAGGSPGRCEAAADDVRRSTSTRTSRRVLASSDGWPHGLTWSH